MLNVLSGCATVRLVMRASYIIIALAMFLLTACGEKQGSALGMKPAEISVLDLLDKPLKLSDYQGRVLVLNFWSGGCGPCIAEMPGMESLYQQYKQQGLTILGINQGEDPIAVAGTVKRLDVSYPIAIDQLAISSKRYRVKAVPATFILDRQGILRYKLLGEISREQLEKIITPLLGITAAAEQTEVLKVEIVQNNITTPVVQSVVAKNNNIRVSSNRISANPEKGKDLYRKRCRDCHGRYAKKQAMGRSKPLIQLTSNQIEATLKKYQNTTAATKEARFKIGLSDLDIQNIQAYLLSLQSRIQAEY